MKIKLVLNGAKVPTRSTSGSACYDIYADEKTVIEPGKSLLIHTRLYMELPKATVGLVCSRSGLASRGVFVTNSPGIIDSDYRGEVGVILTNLNPTSYCVAFGDRIAQMLFLSEQGFCNEVEWELVTQLSPTERAGGFGSTGK